MAVPLCLVSPPWEQISGVSGRLPQCAVGWETVRRLDQLGGGVQTCCAAGLGQCEKERKPLLWEGGTCIRKITGVFLQRVLL